MSRLIGTVSLAAMTVVVACGSGDVRVSDVRVGQPTGPNAALYFSATAGSEPDRLIGAETNSANAVEIHETTTGDDGTMSMRPVDGLDVDGDAPLVLEPGGFHLMLIDADRLEVGDFVEVTLNWEDAGEMTIEAEVVDPAETMSDDS